MHTHLTRWGLVLITVLTLVSCTTQPGRDESAGTAPSDEAQLQERVTELLQSARSAPPRERPKYLISAAEQLLAAGQADWAFNLLSSIEPANVGDYTFLDYADAFSQAALESGRYFKAREALFDKRLEALWGSIDNTRQQALLERRATVESLLGDYERSLYARLRLGDYIADASSQQWNNEAIWQDLMSLPEGQLRSLANPEENKKQDANLEGWAQLALIARNNAANLSRQRQRVEAWQREWPSHPASRELPSDLQLLRQLIDQQPRTVALLLPQKGRLAPAATAVRDGFLAAYFNQGDDEFRPQVRQYDTSEADINRVYEQALSEGAELIVGPLAKDNVEILAQREDLRVPVLALNYRESDARQKLGAIAPEPQPVVPTGNPLTDTALFTPKLYQFGLAPEDEARQLARYAHLQGHKRAMMIAPDIDWAARSVQTFAEQWRELGGEIVADSRFIGAGDYSEVIEQSLLIDLSKQRHRTLREIIYTNMEFEPRRRQDIDVIVLLANPRQARQIKPTLAFHYAGDLPVLATSQVYNGESDAKLDRDLNGVRFATLPWLFSQSAEARDVGRHSEAPAAYRRLHAMGVDAYHLYPRLPQLDRLPQTRLLGTTGELSMTDAGRIQRETIWAEFEEGIARPVADRSVEQAAPR